MLVCSLMAAQLGTSDEDVQSFSLRPAALAIPFPIYFQNTL